MEYTNYVESSIYKLIHCPNNDTGQIKLFLQSIQPIIEHHQKHFNHLMTDKWTYQNVIKILDNNQSYTILIQYFILLLYLFDHNNEYHNDIHEKYILKMLLYTFYILVPTITNITYTIEEKLNILYYCMNIYLYINNHPYLLYCYEDLNYLLSKSNVLKKVNHRLLKKIKMLHEYIHYILKHY
jgi:hypothetical protein